MKEPIELVNKESPDVVLAHACGECGIVCIHEEHAKFHCGPWLCKECGEEAPQHYTKCSACQKIFRAKKLAERAEAAVKVAHGDWEGPVFVESAQGNPVGSCEGFHETVEIAIDNIACMDAEEIPDQYDVWGSREIVFDIDASRVIECELEDHHDEAEVSPDAEEELQEFLARWSKRQDIKSYESTYGTVITGIQEVVAKELA